MSTDKEAKTEEGFSPLPDVLGHTETADLNYGKIRIMSHTVDPNLHALQIHQYDFITAGWFYTAQIIKIRDMLTKYLEAHKSQVDELVADSANAEGRHPLFDEMYPSEVLVIVPLVEGLDLEIYPWREYQKHVDMSDEWLMPAEEELVHLQGTSLPALLNAAHQKLIDVHAKTGEDAT